jgi:prevent-host-death family protein
LAATTLTSREFSKDVVRAKKGAMRGPVFITDRGRPTHVLLTIEDYRHLTSGSMTLLEALAQTGNVDFDFDPPRLGNLFKPVDLD